MTNQSFDNQVKQKATEHEAPVPAGVWEAIIKDKKKKRYPLFWWITGSALLFVVVGFGIRYMLVDSQAELTRQETKDIQKANVLPKDDKNTALDTPPASTASSYIPDATDKNIVVPVAVQKASSGNDVTVKQDQSAVTNNQQSNQTSSISIVSIPVKSKKSPLAKSLSQQRNIVTTHGNNSKHNTDIVVAGKKQVPVKNSGGSVSNDSEPNAPTYSSVLLTPANSNSDPVIISEIKLTTWSRNGYSLLNKQWKDLTVNHPAIAGNMIKPLTPAIKRIKIKPSRWSIDISVIPFQPIRQKHSLLSLNRTTTDHMHTADYKPGEIATTLKPSVAYSLGINKKINKYITIGSGLQYTVIKEHINLSGKETNTSYQVVQRLDNSGPSPVLITDTVASVTTGTRIIGAINSYRFLEIPLFIQYTLIEKPSWSLRLNGGVQLGISSRYHNSIKGRLVPEHSPGSPPQNNTAMGIGFFTGVRFTNRLTRKYQVFAAPYLRLSTGNNNAIINNRSIHQAGMALGINYKIGR
jgi:hypothetical protein